MTLVQFCYYATIPALWFNCAPSPCLTPDPQPTLMIISSGAPQEHVPYSCTFGNTAVTAEASDHGATQAVTILIYAEPHLATWGRVECESRQEHLVSLD